MQYLIRDHVIHETLAKEVVAFLRSFVTDSRLTKQRMSTMSHFASVLSLGYRYV